MGALLVTNSLRNSYINFYPDRIKKWLSNEQKKYAHIWSNINIFLNETNFILKERLN